MDTKIYNEEGTSSIVITGNRLNYKLTTDFWISDQPDFINALDRNYQINEIERKNVGAVVSFRCTKEQSSTIVDDIDSLFQESYVEKFT